jgi:hypothetical protein
VKTQETRNLTYLPYADVSLKQLFKRSSNRHLIGRIIGPQVTSIHQTYSFCNIRFCNCIRCGERSYECPKVSTKLPPSIDVYSSLCSCPPASVSSKVTLTASAASSTLAFIFSLTPSVSSLGASFSTMLAGASTPLMPINSVSKTNVC